ncbi:MAG: transporter [Chthoniobacteraceae bacterium]
MSFSHVRGPNGKKTLHVTDNDFGFSDMVILPGIIDWDHGNWHWTLGLGIYAPTGDYSPDDLAPLGKNYWSFEPFGGVTYLNTKNGIEVSAGAALDFNTTNHDTDYRSGNQLNLEWLVAQHLAGGFSVGATGYYYQQFTGDRGSGATNGDFRARTAGIGPTLGFTWKDKFAMNLQWFHEFDTSRRFEGDVISFNASWTF